MMMMMMMMMRRRMTTMMMNATTTITIARRSKFTGEKFLEFLLLSFMGQLSKTS